MSHKLESGGPLPTLHLPVVDGEKVTLGKAQTPGNWQVVIVYRGIHCPLCNKYLKRLEELYSGFTKAGAEVVAVSGDPLAKAEAIVKNNQLTFPVAYDLSVEQMQTLGLYITEPREDDDTDQRFAEPATFGINPDGKLQLIEISNTPFNRADLVELLDTVEWIQETGSPIRGTYTG